MIKPTLKVRKYLLIISILAITIICIFLAANLVDNWGSDVEQNLESYANDITGRIASNINTRILSVTTHLKDSGIDKVTALPELTSFLEGISTSEQRYLLLALNDGNFESVEQQPGITSIPAEYVAEPYTIQKVYNNMTSSEDMATIIPLSALMSTEIFSGYYIAMLESETDYANAILDGVISSDQYAVLFTEWGTPIEFRPYTGNNSKVEMDEHILKIAQSYHSDTDKVELEPVAGVPFDYIILTDYISPSGYFLAVYVDTLQHMPVMSRVLQLLYIIVGLAVITILLAILYRQNHKEHTKNISMVDPLTGVLNQASMQEKLNAFIKRNNGKACCLACIDIAAFHNFNAMYGYAAGDKLLVLIGEVLQKQYPLVFRLSNDVFAFVVEKPQFDIGDFDHDLFKKVQQELGKLCAESVSIKAGVVSIGGKTDVSRELVEKALFAVKEAKQGTEQSTIVYDQRLDTVAEFKKNIEVNMIHALSKGEFKIYIQPKITTEDRALCGGEALIRWHSEQMGVVKPDRFIPIFEDNGFIVEIDFFMMTSVLMMLQERLDSGKPIMPISVNQSRVTLMHPNYKERLNSTLSSFSVPHKYVEIEITESSFERDSERLVDLVDYIKSLGFPVNMDDFGAGYSSLNILRRLPIDIIKIDRGFLGEADTSYQSRMIIKSVIGMSHDIGIKVVCEGVETEIQFEFLKEAECDSIQGYLFSKAIPKDCFFARFIDID